MIDFSKIMGNASQGEIEPRDVFMSLPNKDKHYGYPRDVQTEVWKQWFDKRNNKNTIIKMNTGSGKTVVGLTILQSCLNEGKGPAVYIVPDNYLVSQVCLEAKKLGIRVACDKFDKDGKCIEKGEDDFYFKSKKAILVANVHKLVNGKSIFGMRASNNVRIGSIILDDVHSCMDTIEQQFTIKIEESHPLYNLIIRRFEQYKIIKDSPIFYDITQKRDQKSNKVIPFWVWQECCEDIRRLLTQPEYSNDPIVVFNLPLLINNWKTCNCVVSARYIEISPKGVSISQISSFEQAERRIFMSATLADDSVFISAMGLSVDDINNIITPEKANDIGDRLILIPRHLNASIEDENIKEELVNLSRNNNVVVIVPSFERLLFWNDVITNIPTQVLSSRDKNIEKGIDDLKTGKFKGLTILVNKYDGVDLPDDACRFLVIDGLPLIQSEYDMALQGMNPADKRICRESIQKIEQGMGRGVRSNNDYCVVVLMGNKLSDVIINQNGYEFFSRATLAQYEISVKLWEQLMNDNNKPTVVDIFKLADYVLKRDNGWVTLCKSALNGIKYENSAKVDSVIVAQRRAFEQECICRYDEAFNIIEKEKNENHNIDEKAKGVLMQLMAEYKNFENPARAQEILLSAQKFNNMILKPIAGIQYEKLNSFNKEQGEYILQYIKCKGFNTNSYIIHVDSILDNLIFSSVAAKAFEEALDNIATVLGIKSSRPERDDIKGSPDNLWAIGELEYLVIECKNGVQQDIAAISKSDCSQLLSSIQWFNNHYGESGCKCYPIIIHRTNVFDEAASPSPNMRVMTEPKLEEFKHNIREFVKNISQNNFQTDIKEIQKLLKYYKLDGSAIVNEYTVAPNKQ